MRKTPFILATLAAAALGIWAFYQTAYVASRGGETAPLYSTRRYDPYGSAALDQLLRERRIPVRELQRPRLQPTDRGTLIQILHTPPREKSHGDDLAQRMPLPALLDWIAAGNTLICCTRHDNPLLARLSLHPVTPTDPSDKSDEFDSPADDIESAQAAGLSPDKLAWPAIHARWTSASSDDPVRFITLRQPLEFDIEKSPDWKPLAFAGRRVVAAERRYHAGRVIVIGAPTIALNHSLDDADNLDVMLDLVGQGPVIFDDWSHGIGLTGSVIEILAQFGLVPVILQCILLVVVYHWSTRGHPPAHADASPRSRAAVEEIATLGRLYQQGLSPEQTAARVADIMLHRVAQHLRCAPADVPQRLAARS
ncbi:MAG: DUF4350 domain-containing protein, partial [Phycisphaeraceae bacterium]